MFTSRLVLPSAMTWTEKSAFVANLPHLYKHTRAIPAACCLILLLLSVLRVLVLQLIALSSLLVTCNEKRKKKRTSQKAKKTKNFGKVLFPNNYFSRRQLRAETGGEVGRYAAHVLRGGRDLSKVASEGAQRC